MKNPDYSQDAEDDGYGDTLYAQMCDERDMKHDDVRFCPHCQQLRLTTVGNGTATCKTCGMSRSEG